MTDLDLPDLDPNSQLRLAAFFDGIGQLLGHKNRRGSFALYALGLLGDGERKSAEPIAARLCPDPDKVQATHFKLCNFLRRATWKDAPVREFAASYALEAMQQRSPIRTWIIDDTGFLKKGDKSPGVHRQYTGSAGKITNCQVAVSLTLASDVAHLPVDFRLYLPKAWTDDRERCHAAHIPDSVDFAPKWQLALDMIDVAREADFPQGVVLADADYGRIPAFRDGLETRGLQFVAGIKRDTMLRRVRGRKKGPLQTVEDLAFELDPKLLRKVTWREGTKNALASQCATIRVLVEHADGREPTEQWLLIEWPAGSHLPTRFALSNLPHSTSRKQLFRTYKERWRTERAYQDLKGQLGLDHFEGRSFTGWHHHVTTVLCCFAFCVAEQARAFPPSASRARRDRPLSVAA